MGVFNSILVQFLICKNQIIMFDTIKSVWGGGGGWGGVEGGTPLPASDDTCLLNYHFKGVWFKQDTFYYT